MGVIVSMLRGVNLGGHNKLSMQELRALYESLGFQDVRTYIQSGNVIFRTDSGDHSRLSKRIGDAIEQRFGFRCDVVLRTMPELRRAIANNPFAKRSGIEGRKLLVMFLAADPGPTGCEKLVRLASGPEEAHLRGRELYIYFPNGMGRPTVSPAVIERSLGTAGTGRNWNTVQKLLEVAEELEKGAAGGS
jgi:uncharacterized protein (DUF1697 family)